MAQEFDNSPSAEIAPLVLKFLGNNTPHADAKDVFAQVPIQIDRPRNCSACAVVSILTSNFDIYFSFAAKTVNKAYFYNFSQNNILAVTVLCLNF